MARTPLFAFNRSPRLWSPQMFALAVAVLWVLVGLLAYRGQRWGELDEPYSLVETFYVMAQIVTTVGYGDYYPTQESSFLFTALYVLTATVVISSLGTALTDSIMKGHSKIMATTLKDLHFSRLPDIELTSGLSAPGLSLSMPELSPGLSALLQAASVWLLCVLAGVIFFCSFPGEDKTFIEAFYISVMTTTTVGFGDSTPSTEGGQVFTTIWMLVGTAAFANMIAKFSAAFLAQRQLRKLEKGDLTDITRDELYKRCHPERDCQISRADFILFMMKDIGALNADLVEHFSDNFDELDERQVGFLDTDCIEGFTRMYRSHVKRSGLPRFHTIS